MFAKIKIYFLANYIASKAKPVVKVFYIYNYILFCKVVISAYKLRICKSLEGYI